MKLSINNLETAFTIDTYGMFNGESTDEMECEFYREEYDLTDDQWRDLCFDYDCPAIVVGLATESVGIIEQVVDRDVVRSVSRPSKTSSPQFYNYTTDSYVAEWDIDDKLLLEQVETLVVDGQTFQAFQLSTGWGLLDDQASNYIYAALDFWSQQYREEYTDRMFDRESEIYLEHMTLDSESQAIIDNATRKEQ